MQTYAALLRGINVGKSVQVPMKELKVLLEGLGATNVVTYLNSGNAVFDSPEDGATFRSRLEAALAGRFGQEIPTLVVGAAEVCQIAKGIPLEWQNNNEQQTYIAYLFPGVDPTTLIYDLPVKKQYIRFLVIGGALVWNIARADYNRSQITKLAGHSSYRLMTTRNVNTARKLAELCARGALGESP